MLNKSITFTGVMLAAGAITLHIVHRAEPEVPITTEVTSFDEETTSRVVNYRAFKETLSATLKRLERGEINLREATVCVYGASKQFCPIYLERVALSDVAPTLEMSVALNLVEHLRSLSEFRPELSRRVSELNSEFRNLANHPEVANVR